MEISENVDLETISKVFSLQKEKGRLLRAEPIAKRKERIRKLEKYLMANRKAIHQALQLDMGKPESETDTSEIYPVLVEIRTALSNLDSWTSPKPVASALTYLGTKSDIRFEPLGTCLIISPWNFPLNLCLGPLVSCLAAGNTAILKPSEITPKTSALIKDIVNSIFDPEEVAVFEGGREVSECLLTHPFDHIFFTGSPQTGKIIMREAAKHLSSVTLELGGKSPVLILADANLTDAARRVAFGKFLNCGQTCIAPDYVLIEKHVSQRFIEELKKATLEIYGSGGSINEQSRDYSRIVNQHHFNRLKELLHDAIERDSKTEMWGSLNGKTNFFSPVILTGVTPEARLMNEEIFGPILPILEFEMLEEAVTFINNKPKPLALYLFSRNRKVQSRILKSISSGTACINDVVIQFTHPNLPFGGVNFSGLGKAHGHQGFLTFSNQKSVLHQKSGFSIASLLYPPYTTVTKRIINVLLRWF